MTEFYLVKLNPLSTQTPYLSPVGPHILSKN